LACADGDAGLAAQIAAERAALAAAGIPLTPAQLLLEAVPDEQNAVCAHEISWSAAN